MTYDNIIKTILLIFILLLTVNCNFYISLKYHSVLKAKYTLSKARPENAKTVTRQAVFLSIDSINIYIYVDFALK